MKSCTYPGCTWSVDKNGDEGKETQSLRMHTFRKHTPKKRKYTKRMSPRKTKDESQSSKATAGYNANFCPNCGCPLHIVQTAMHI